MGPVFFLFLGMAPVRAGPSAGWIEVCSRPLSLSLTGSPGSTPGSLGPLGRSPWPQPSLDGSPPLGLVRSFDAPAIGSQEGFKEDSGGFSESLVSRRCLECLRFRGEGFLASAPLGEGSLEVAVSSGEASLLWLLLCGKASCIKLGACARGERSLGLKEAR